MQPSEWNSGIPYLEVDFIESTLQYHESVGLTS